MPANIIAYPVFQFLHKAFCQFVISPADHRPRNYRLCPTCIVCLVSMGYFPADTTFRGCADEKQISAFAAGPCPGNPASCAVRRKDY